MKLTNAIFHSFRSVTNDVTLEVDPEVTILVGPNEGGKSNVLLALESFDTSEYEQEDVCSFSEWGMKGNVPAGTPILTLTFLIEDEDLDRLAEVSEKFANFREFSVTIHFNHSRSIDLLDEEMKRRSESISQHQMAARRGVSALQAHLNWISTTFPQYGEQLKPCSDSLNAMGGAVQRNQVKSMRENLTGLQTSLKELPIVGERDQESRGKLTVAVEDEVTEFANLLESPTPVERVYRMTPVMVFVDADIEYLLPAEVNLREVAADAEDAERKFDIVRRLLMLGGIELQDYFSLNAQRRGRLLNLAAERITKRLQKVWTQEDVRIELDAEGDLLRISVETPGGDFGFPQRRSRGFQWFLAFYITYAAVATELKGSILLIDEPGIHLHPKAQKDLVQRLREIGKECQVIYSTQLPDLVDLENPERVRVVSREPGPGTTIINQAWQPREAGVGFEVVMRALWGNVFAPSMTLGPYNLILEGASDHIYILSVGKVLAKTHQSYRPLVNGEITLYQPEACPTSEP